MSSSLSLLLVEDLAVDAELCEHELRRAGFEFNSRRVQSRDQYERALEEIGPDLILSDFSMPGDLDGFLALSIARERAPAVPFIFVSGTIGEERAVEAMKAGATDYVLKDRLERLGPVVRRAIDEAQARRLVSEAEGALRASEATFRSFMQHLPGRASICGPDGCYLYVNAYWQEAFGVSASDVIGQHYDVVLQPLAAREFAPLHERVMANGEPVQRIVERVHGDRSRWWLIHHFPIPDATGSNALVGTVAVDVTEQKVQGEQLAWLAWHDPLTGLGNRTQLRERLSDAIRELRPQRESLAVLVWNIKRFSRINESLGAEVGDSLLCALANRLTSLWPEVTATSRLSADYFGAFLHDTADAPRAVSLLERSAQALAQPFMIGDREIAIDLTIGVALCPQDSLDADALLANADAALKQARVRGERYLFYETAMNARVAERLSLESRLRRALEREQFFLHYEPKVDLQTGRVRGLEALLRWREGENVLVPPQQFISVLEDTGLILEVGKWVLTTALQEWRARAGRSRTAPRIAVNVSAMQLRRPDFVEVVSKVIDREGNAAHGLDLEITETVLMEDIEENASKIHALKEMGVRVAIDDFGTGYSSLSYLAALPVDALKIDRAFISTLVENQQSMTIVSTIISLAHTLRMTVVAEGVERSSQANLLRDLRCDQAQGFFFSIPEEPNDSAESDSRLPPAR